MIQMSQADKTERTWPGQTVQEMHERHRVRAARDGRDHATISREQVVPENGPLHSIEKGCHDAGG